MRLVKYGSMKFNKERRIIWLWHVIDLHFYLIFYITFKKEIENSIREETAYQRVLSVASELTDNTELETNMDKIQQNGETYVNSFDFFQRLQRWMYQHGLFNFHAFGAV